MKAILISAVLAVSTMAFADTINPKDHSCTDLQTMLRENGSLEIKGPFGYDTHFSTPSCPEDYRANYAYIFAAEKALCGLGYVCQIDMKGQ